MDKVGDKGIRVVHLQFGSSPSGNYTIRQHEGLLEIGVDSYVLSLQSEVYGNPRIQELGKFAKFVRKLNLKWSSVLSKKKSSKKMDFQFSLNGVDVRNHELVQKADFIYVHWVLNGFLSISSLKKLASLGKPLIIVLHDMWFTTGGCLHSFDCDKFLNQCHNCPVLKGDKEKDYSFYQYNEKLEFYNGFDNIFFISPSFWLCNLAKSSRLMQNKAIFRIPNMIDIRIFKPIDKVVAKKILNVDEYDYVLTFGAFNLNSPYKGWTYLTKSLELLKEKMAGKNVCILIFGASRNETMIDSIPFPVKFMGHVKDDYATSIIFNATDVFLAPSLADNLPTTILESMFCGTAVVGFDVGGIPEMIRHQKTGYLAKYKDAADFANGIQFCLDNNIKGSISEEFLPSVIQDQHLELYQFIKKKLNK